MPIDALNVLFAQLTRDLFAIAKFLHSTKYDVMTNILFRFKIFADGCRASGVPRVSVFKKKCPPRGSVRVRTPLRGRKGRCSVYPHSSAPRLDRTYDITCYRDAAMWTSRVSFTAEWVQWRRWGRRTTTDAMSSPVSATPWPIVSRRCVENSSNYTHTHTVRHSRHS